MRCRAHAAYQRQNGASRRCPHGAIEETMLVTQHIDRVFERAIEAGVVPGVIALAANDHGMVYEGAFGQREIGNEPAMTLDSVVWIASMTKAITAVAALQLVEQGRLALDEPLGALLPELAAV